MKKSVAVRAVGVSKEYRLGTLGHKMITSDFMSIWRRLSGTDEYDRSVLEGGLDTAKPQLTAQASPTSNRFLALDDVSFEVYPGEALGIIGANGAGKSTLLKLVSRVTLPSKGKILIIGRILSMLEVGTGFNPDLTGRTNVYMNGLILGMSKTEITKKFDEIVDFAEIGQFIDTPVKRYSSGMQIRLAFSVAAHFVPEIIIVDEVLAVGDAQFQRKCIDKMEEVLRKGRAILFVSHDMRTIASFCNKGLWLDKGRTQFYGSATDAILHYENSANRDKDLFATYIDVENESPHIGTTYVQLLSSRLLNEEHMQVEAFNIDQKVIVQMKYRILEKNSWIAMPLFRFMRMDGTCAFVSSSLDQKSQNPGDYQVECSISENFLNDGLYYIDVIFGSNHEGEYVEHFNMPRALMLRMLDPFDELNRLRLGNSATVMGTVRPTSSINWVIDTE